MEDRFTRIETKIDSLQEAVIQLARVEERLSTVFKRQAVIEAKVDALADKTGTRFIERIFWIVFATAATVAANYL